MKFVSRITLSRLQGVILIAERTGINKFHTPMLASETNKSLFEYLDSLRRGISFTFFKVSNARVCTVIFHLT
jgi:hypothetical protein